MQAAAHHEVRASRRGQEAHRLGPHHQGTRAPSGQADAARLRARRHEAHSGPQNAGGGAFDVEQVHLAHEFGDEAADRAGIDLVRRRDLFEPARRA